MSTIYKNLLLWNKFNKMYVILGSSLAAQWVNDLALSLLWLGSLLGVGSIPGLRTSACCGCGQKKDVQYLYTENYKTSMKELKDLNKQ